ncbi:MAG TPA: hypothetical protein VEZ14_09745 [Dehalococcoidia bacterium]|nr:hypothetical protein [Dehalococcoidia bacterium]
MTADAAPPRPPRKDGALHFPLQDGEQVLQICRRHWVYLWPRTVWYALLALVPVVAVAVAINMTAGLGGTAGKIFWVAALVYLLYWLLRVYLNWYRYNNDIWVVTNQRIIDSTKTTPFNMKMSTADLVSVLDMTVERNGVFRTMFNYGDIVCQTAADIQEFRMAGIPHPQEVQLLVDKERDRERTRGR